MQLISKRARLLDDFEDLQVKSLITAQDLKKVYELEYKLSVLKSSQKPSALRKIEPMEAELSVLLRKCLSAMKQLYHWWIQLHKTGIVSPEMFYEKIAEKYPLEEKRMIRSLDMWLIGDRTRFDREFFAIEDELKKEIWSSQPFSGILSVYRKLAKGSGGDSGSDMVLFQEALTTTHRAGPMMNHLSENTNITKGLLDDLTNGVFNKEWDTQISKFAADANPNAITQPVVIDDEAAQRRREEAVPVAREMLRQMTEEQWQKALKEDTLRPDLTEKEVFEAASNPKDPSWFFGYPELWVKYPQFIDMAAENLIHKQPQVYFIMKLYKNKLFSRYAQRALFSLLNIRPEVYFNIGLYEEEEFKPYKRGAAFSVAEHEPKYFLDVLLPLMPEFEDLRQKAEERLRRKTAMTILTRSDLEKIYELEYKLFKLKDSGNVFVVNRLEKELSELLHKGITALKLAFEQWLFEYDQQFQKDSKESIKQYKEIPQYEGMPEELIYDMLKQKHLDNKVYKGIKKAYADLGVGWTGNMGKDMALFQIALTTMHHNGSIIQYMPGYHKSGIDLELLNDLDSGQKYIEKWDRELSKKASISKRAKVKTDAAGVFAVLPEKLAKQFPSLGDHDSSKPHITVLYIGAVPEKQMDLLENTVKGVLYNQEPFEVTLDEKASYFPASKHSDGCKIAKIGVSSKQLHSLHNRLKEAVKAVGIEIDDHFPNYKPHITLEYMPPPKEKYEDPIPKGSWTVKSVEIWRDGKKRYIDCVGKKLSKRAEDDFSETIEELKNNPIVSKETYTKTKDVELWHGVGHKEALKELPNGKYLLTPKPGMDLQKLWFVPAWNSETKQTAMGYAEYAMVRIKIPFEFTYTKNTYKDGTTKDWLESYKPIPSNWERSWQVQEWFLHNGPLELEPSQITTRDDLEAEVISQYACDRSISKRAKKDPLKIYKKKRDFEKTPEPEPKAEKGPNKHRYVIQEHDAEKAGKHFDLRLENDRGTLSSWAIPKHKLPVKGERLLATKTEDHPIGYAGFSGKIDGKASYGRGNIKIVSKGKVYKPFKWTKDTIQFEIDEGKFTLHRMDKKRWIISRMSTKTTNNSSI